MKNKKRFKTKNWLDEKFKDPKFRKGFEEEFEELSIEEQLAHDSTINAIVQVLKKKYHCHTIVLYGSRARGQTTPTSDYDVIGVSRHGKKTRIAKKQNSHY